MKDGLMLLGGGVLVGLVGLGLIKVGKATKMSPFTMVGGLCIAATVILTLAALAKFWDALSEGANVLGL